MGLVTKEQLVDCINPPLDSHRKNIQNKEDHSEDVDEFDQDSNVDEFEGDVDDAEKGILSHLVDIVYHFMKTKKTPQNRLICSYLKSIKVCLVGSLELYKPPW
jgi:hypothetical protein